MAVTPRPGRWLGVLMTSIGLAHGGCEQVAGFQEFAGANPEAGVPHRCDVLSSKKPDALDLAVLVLGKGLNGRCFWIDETEVTVEQYARFVDENPGFSAWDTKRCAWKSEPSRPHVQASDTCASDALALDADAFGAQKPIRCVDWCDATAFCRWAQKDLCVDGYGMSYEPQGAPRDWSMACSPQWPLPYGPEPASGACNIGLSQQQCVLIRRSTWCRAADVHSFPECTYPAGPVDMIGNVSEWIRSCTAFSDGGPDVLCQRRGGSYGDALTSWNCTTATAAALRRDSRLPDLGFRCCSELTPAEAATVGG